MVVPQAGLDSGAISLASLPEERQNPIGSQLACSAFLQTAQEGAFQLSGKQAEHGQSFESSTGGDPFGDLGSD